MEDLKKDIKENEPAVIEDTEVKVLKFGKTYSFEGKTISSVDLSGLDDLTAADMIRANKILARTGSTTVDQEITLEYACVFASLGTELPMEFFKALHPRDAIKLKNRVTAFLYGLV